MRRLCDCRDCAVAVMTDAMSIRQLRGADAQSCSPLLFLALLCALSPSPIATTASHIQQLTHAHFSIISQLGAAHAPRACSPYRRLLWPVRLRMRLLLRGDQIVVLLLQRCSSECVHV